MLIAKCCLLREYSYSAIATIESMPESAHTIHPPLNPPITMLSVIAPIVGWLVPGGGHFLQGKWGRGVLLAVSVVTMFTLGILMQGKVYAPNTGDILDILGFIGDAGAGALYFIARGMDWGRGAINLATADYGTKYIIVAGLLNIM